MKKTILFAYMAIALFTQCKKSRHNLEEDIKREFEAKLHPKLKNIAVISQNDVYYLPELESTPVRLTNSPTLTKTKVKVSHDGTKVAFLNASSQPVILGTDGKEIATLSNYSSVTKVDWSQDDKTLIILSNNQFYFYGPALNIPIMTYKGTPFSNIYGGYIDVHSFAVSPSNDLLYSFQIYESSYYSYGNYYEKVIFKANGSTTDELLLSDSQYDQGSELNFVNGTQDMAIGIKATNSPNLVGTLKLYRYGSSYSYTSFSSSSYPYICPIYRSDLSYFLAGQRDDSYSTERYVVASTRNGAYGQRDVTLSQFYGSPGQLYLDWK